MVQAHLASLNVCRLLAAEFMGNHHAPAGERAAVSENSTDALGIPEFRLPAAMDF